MKDFTDWLWKTDSFLAFTMIMLFVTACIAAIVIGVTVLFLRGHGLLALALCLGVPAVALWHTYRKETRK